MEKRVVMAESMLEGTLQYQSGQAKCSNPSRFTNLIDFDQIQLKLSLGILSMLNLVVITLQNAIESIERAVEHGIMNFLISSDSTMPWFVLADCLAKKGVRLNKENYLTKRNLEKLYMGVFIMSFFFSSASRVIIYLCR